jgi:hypothetical protein
MTTASGKSGQSDHPSSTPTEAPGALTHLEQDTSDHDSRAHIRATQRVGAGRDASARSLNDERYNVARDEDDGVSSRFERGESRGGRLGGADEAAGRRGGPVG